MSLVAMESTAVVRSALGQTTQDFRIDTDLYMEHEARPYATVKTIFTKGKYIEVDEANKQVTIMNLADGQITVIDEARALRTNINMIQIESTLNRAEAEMDEKTRRSLYSDSEPSIDSDGYTLLKNASIRYRFKSQSPTKESFAIEYANFANWSMRLNALYLKRPPQLRIQVNELLASEGQIPLEIRLSSIQPGSKGEVIARIHVVEALGQWDKEQMSRIDSLLRTTSLINDELFYAKQSKSSVAQRNNGASK